MRRFANTLKGSPRPIIPLSSRSRNRPESSKSRRPAVLKWSTPGDLSLGAVMQFGKRTHKPNSVYAVIPLDAALPRTFISDLPGGFGHCIEQPFGAGPAPNTSLAPWLALPSLFGLAPCGVYPASVITAGAVRSYRTFSPLPLRGADHWSTSLFQKAAPRNGGMFSVALAVREP